jgi:hypothetical protein
MTDEKPIFDKFTNSDSPEPKEPIDFSGLMKPATDTEDDGIIELTEEVQMSSESENEATEIRRKYPLMQPKKMKKRMRHPFH